MKFYAMILFSLLFLAESLAQTTTPSTPTPDFTILPEKDVIFGIDFLGWGFWVGTSRDPFFALKPPLFDWTYAQNPTQRERTYRYPVDTVTYSVPDQVYVRTVARTTTDTYIYTSTEEEQLQLDIGLNLQGETPTLKGSLKFDLTYITKDTIGKRIVRNEVYTELFQLYMNSERLLKSEFTTRLAALNTAYDANPQDWDLFVADFGTHYVDSVIVGGSVLQRTIVKTTSNDEALRFSVVLNGRIQKATTKFEGSLNVTYQQASTFVDNETTSRAEIIGGAAEYTDFLLKGGADDSTQTLFATWKSTLVTNPVTCRYRLVELWALSTNTFKRLQLCKAVKVGSGYDLKDVDALCKKIPEISDGSIRAAF